MGSRRWQGRRPCRNGWSRSRRHRHQRPDDDGRSQVDHRSDSTKRSPRQGSLVSPPLESTDAVADHLVKARAAVPTSWVPACALASKPGTPWHATPDGRRGQPGTRQRTPDSTTASHSPPPARQTDGRHRTHRQACPQRVHRVHVRRVIARRGVQIPSPALFDVHPFGGMIVGAP
jgi:hypothetical protein